MKLSVTFVKISHPKSGQHKFMKKSLKKGLKKACNRKIERKYRRKDYNLILLKQKE